MKKLATPLIAVFMLALPATAVAAGSKLHGKWQATSMAKEGKKKEVPPGMKIVVEFVKGGVFKATITYRGKGKTKTGTWKVKGNVLETNVEGKKEKMTYKVKGNILKLIEKKSGSNQVMSLKKL